MQETFLMRLQRVTHDSQLLALANTKNGFTDAMKRIKDVDRLLSLIIILTENYTVARNGGRTIHTAEEYAKRILFTRVFIT